MSFATLARLGCAATRPCRQHMTARALRTTLAIRKPSPAGRLAAGRAYRAGLARPRRAGGTRLLPARKVLYQFTARGHDVTQVLLGQMLTGARDGIGVYYRSRPLMLALGLTRRRCAGLDDDALRQRERRPRHRRRVQSAATRRAVRAAGLRWRRCAVHAGRRLGAVAAVSRAGAARRARRRQHRGRARRRGVGRDQRLLVRAHDRDDAAPAGPVLHRRQRLRHLGEVRLPDAGRQHRREPRGVPQPEDPRRRQRRSARRGRD